MKRKINNNTWTIGNSTIRKYNGEYKNTYYVVIVPMGTKTVKYNIRHKT